MNKKKIIANAVAAFGTSFTASTSIGLSEEQGLIIALINAVVTGAIAAGLELQRELKDEGSLKTLIKIPDVAVLF